MRLLAAWAERVGGLRGWRRHGLAVLLGLLGGLALPPFGVIPFLWLALPGLVWLMDSAPRKRGAFAAGWWWGFGHFSLGFYWIAHAMLIDPLKFGWMIPFAVFGLAGGMALFPGLATLAARRFPAGPSRVMLLAVAWVLVEWLRDWVLTGFPWNLLGSVWIAVLPVAQLASVFGVYGLSLLTILAAGMPAVLARGRTSDKAAVLGGFVLLAAAAVFGLLRIPAEPSPAWPDITLRLVQGNVNQAEKWSPAKRWMHIQQHVELSRAPGREQVTAVIWPETAAQSFLEQDRNARGMLAEAVPPGGLLLTGAPRGTFDAQGDIIEIWNSLQAMDGQGHLLGSYDKAHLVPFGEYVPLSKVLPLPKLTAGAIDFTPGSGPRTLRWPGLPPAGPMICYEAIFPGEVVDRADRPDWLLNITNDGWFGLSAGPYQHFAASRLRAIEEGLPLARAANTGITAVVDGYGRVLGEISLGQSGFLDSPLPKPLSSFCAFAQWGVRVVFLLLSVVLAAAAMWRRLFDYR